MLLGFRTQFGGPLLACAVLVVVASLVGLALASQRGADGRRRLRQAARVLAVGAALVVFVGTAAPDTWPPTTVSDGDLVLRFGRGGLGEGRVLLDDPNSLAAVLLVANVLLYVPLGFFGRLGWPRTVPVLVSTVLLSALVETLQWQALGRVASTDDFVPNAVGGLMGVLLALPVSRLLTRQGEGR